MSHFKAAETAFQIVLTARERTANPDDPELFAIRLRFAALLDQRVKSPAAERLIRSALASRLRTLGPNHVESESARAHLAENLLAEHLFAAAEPELRQVFLARQHRLGPAAPEPLEFRSKLASALRETGNLAAAEREARHTLAHYERNLGTEHWHSLKAGSPSSSSSSRPVIPRLPAPSPGRRGKPANASGRPTILGAARSTRFGTC